MKKLFGLFTVLALMLAFSVAVHADDSAETPCDSEISTCGDLKAMWMD